MIDLNYFTEELKSDGFEVMVFIDVNKPLDHKVCAQSHHHKYKYEKCFHIDGSIDGLIATYIKKYGPSNILANRHLQSKQTDFVLATPGIALFVDAICLLDFDVIF
jgi:hypothetical protein